MCSFSADLLLRFRWLVLQLAELEECASQYEIETQLGKLPEGLDEICYDFEGSVTNPKQSFRQSSYVLSQKEFQRAIVGDRKSVV